MITITIKNISTGDHITTRSARTDDLKEALSRVVARVYGTRCAFSYDMGGSCSGFGFDRTVIGQIVESPTARDYNRGLRAADIVANVAVYATK